MTFHRLGTNPSGYDSYPSGFDYINTPSLNGDPGSPALTDSKKGSGPNQGTYFVGFGEDGLSMAVNRGLKALAENTDYLDEKVRRPLAIMKSVTGTVAGVPLASIVLPELTGVYLGSGGGVTPETVDTLFQIVDSNYNEIIIQSTGLRVAVSTVSGGTIGAGFALAQVTLNLSVAIPVGTSYRVLYSIKGNLGDMARDAVAAFNPRAAVKTGAEVENLFRVLRAPVALSEPWNSSPFHSTIWDLAISGINDRYRRATSVNTSYTRPDDYYPAISATDTAGAGAWWERRGPAITGYSNDLNSDTNRYYDPANAIWAARCRDSGSGSAVGGAVGYMFYGSRWTTVHYPDSAYSPAYASSLHVETFDPMGTISDNNLTKVAMNAPIEILLDGSRAYVELTSADHYFAKAIPGITGDVASGIACGLDMIEIVWDDGRGTATPHLYLVAAIASDKAVEVRELNGRPPPFPGTPLALPTGFRAWHRMTTGNGSGSIAMYDYYNGGMYDDGVVWLDGFVHTSIAYNTYLTNKSSIGYYEQPGHSGIRKAPARFFGSDLTAYTNALEWGGFEHDVTIGDNNPGYIVKGRLLSNGSAYVMHADTSRVSEQAGVQTSYSTAATTINLSSFRNTWNSPIMYYAFVQGSANLSFTYQNCQQGSRYVVAIERVPGDYRETVSFAGTDRSGNTVTMVIDAADATLSPSDPIDSVVDVYTGVHTAGTTSGGTVFWSVQRYILN